MTAQLDSNSPFARREISPHHPEESPSYPEAPDAPSHPLLARPHDRNELRRFQRKTKHGLLVEPIPGYFADATAWESASWHKKTVTKISAIAHKHPNWPISSVSAAAIYGVNLHARFHRHVHFATDRHTSTGLRKHLPVIFHYIEQSRPQNLRINDTASADGNGQSPPNTYIPINDAIGFFHGFLITSPLQTMFDCMRMLTFEHALIVCNELCRKFRILHDEFLQFLTRRAHCWKSEYARFKAEFVNSRVENGGESFCLARIIREGFAVPELQKIVRNPYFNLPREWSPDAQMTETIRPDMAWMDIHRSSSASVVTDTSRAFSNIFPHIALELDGNAKYSDPTMLAKSGARNSEDIHFRERERHSALNSLGFNVVHVSFREVNEFGGQVLFSKLDKAGVPRVSARRRNLLQRLLAKSMASPTLHRFE